MATQKHWMGDQGDDAEVAYDDQTGIILSIRDSLSSSPASAATDPRRKLTWGDAGFQVGQLMPQACRDGTCRH